tara:strand:+ start:1765 stop:1917 length:153 start_codon:yes stop_codon:yes gene_type:complete
MDGNPNLIFTHYIVQDSWAVIVVQDKRGEIIKLLTEPLFEAEVEFELDIT